MREFRIFGPPGTGKTTFLTKQIQQVVEKHGWDSLIVASFTKTAAQELAGRNKQREDIRCIGTLHSHCFRAIGSREVAESHVKDFNKEFPHFTLTGGGSVSVEDAAQEAVQSQTEGDKLLHQLNVFRARMVPMELWPENIRTFRNAWTTFKKMDGMVDFTDMIEMAYQDLDAAPGNPAIGFFDEAQDFTPLQFALIRKWCKKMDYMVVSGDDDQCIFQFMGATPEVFLSGEAAEKRVLSQSYRVPRVIQTYAEKWIGKVSKREVKEYKPRDYEGEILRRSVTFKMPRDIVLEAKELARQGKSVMFLTSCSFMLDRVIAELRQAGILFHNPYRRNNGAWNPIKFTGGFHSKEEEKKSTIDRLMDYLRITDFYNPPAEFWSYDEVGSWLDFIISKGNLKKGAKKIDPNRTDLMTGEALMELFDENSSFWDMFCGERTKDNALNWLNNNCTGSASKKIHYPSNVLKKNTFEEVVKRPQITVGTIHSVKGGEADVVYIFPDISLSGYQEWARGGETKDSILRMFYVGMTRARETLVLCQTSSNLAVQWM